MPWPKLPPLRPLLGRGEEEAALAKSLPEFLAKVYRHARDLYGEDEAKELWKAAPKKKRGKQKKYLNVSRDAYLLHEYNSACKTCKGLPPKSIKKLPRILGDILYNVEPGRYGSSAETITRHIRRLRDQQEKRRAFLPVRSTNPIGGRQIDSGV